MSYKTEITAGIAVLPWLPEYYYGKPENKIQLFYLI
jgi:hypothetical protein